jgi:hypothetical protein
MSLYAERISSVLVLGQCQALRVDFRLIEESAEGTGKCCLPEPLLICSSGRVLRIIGCLGSLGLFAGNASFSSFVSGLAIGVLAVALIEHCIYGCCCLYDL